jgi:hypothetical protein
LQLFRMKRLAFGVIQNVAIPIGINTEAGGHFSAHAKSLPEMIWLGPE